MSDHAEIRSSQFPHDMSAWGTEKAHNLLEALTELRDLCQCQDNETVADLFHVAIWDGTKLLSFFAGAEWSYEIAKRVAKGGFEAYEELALEWGVIAESRSDRMRRLADGTRLATRESLGQFAVAIANLLSGPRSNRTLIHDLLREMHLDDPIFRLVGDLTERLTMGELDWPEYTRRVTDLLSKLDADGAD